MEYKLTIVPAIRPDQRHKLEKNLVSQGFNVSGGGTNTDMSACDTSFEDDKPEPKE